MRKILFSQTTGEDQPSPGIGVFQAMFSVSLHLVGSLFSDETPCLVGPRKPGQFFGGERCRQTQYRQ